MGPSKAAAEPAPNVDAPLRGLTLLLIAYAGSLGASIIGGALRAHYLTQLWENRSSGAGFGEMMSLLLGGFFILHLIIAGIVLLGMAGIAGAPPEARVTGLARAAVGLLGVSLGLAVLSYGLSRHASSLLPTVSLARILTAVGYVDTVIDLAGTLLIVESLLRLRRYGAPDDPEVASSETSLRGALIGLCVARVIVDYLSHLLGSSFSTSLGTNFWTTYFVRTLFSLLFVGTLLHLIQATAKALRTRPMAPLGSAAIAPDSAALSAEQLHRGYRNLIFGALWALGGIAVTAITYQQASSAGGRFMFAYGAIIFGLIQFIRGLVQVIGRS
jgi:hypothetical protein